MQFTSSYTQRTGKDCVGKTPHNARAHPKVKECHILIKFSSKKILNPLSLWIYGFP